MLGRKTAIVAVVVLTCLGGVVTWADPGDLLVSGLYSERIHLFKGPLSGQPGECVPESFIDTAPLGPYYFAFGPDGNIYVSSRREQGGDIDGVLRYSGHDDDDDDFGAFIDAFVTDASGGIDNPKGLTFGPDGNLYVCSSNSDNVLVYQGPFSATPGQFIGMFTSGVDLNHPNDLIFPGDGYLYVSGGKGQPDATEVGIMRFNASTGAYFDDCVMNDVNLDYNVDGFVFGPDGRIYAVGSANVAVRRSDACGPLEDFTEDDPIECALDNPHGKPVFGPDGKLYVANTNADNVLHYNGETGECLGEYVAAGSCELDGPSFCLFVPEPTPIPAVSEWGLLAMMLLILTAGTLVFMRRRAART